jgi:hypothetical protein
VLTRNIAAIGLMSLLAGAGLACGSSDRAPTERGGASTQSSSRPADRRAGLWRTAVPAAYLRAHASLQAGQRGTLLSAHWLSRDGSVTDSDPRGKVVAWPASVRTAAAPATAFRIALPRRPDRLDVRVFRGGVDRRGVPLEPPQLIACSQSTRERRCRFAVRDRGVEVELREPAVAPITRFVLYARWYVPLAQRPPRARANPAVSASWAFVAARAGRRSAGAGRCVPSRCRSAAPG